MSWGSLSETAMMLPTYSAPVRAIMLGTLGLWGALYAFLLLTAPAPVLTIVRFAKIDAHGAPGLPAFELLLNNGAREPAIIDTALLEFDAGGAPDAGSQAAETTDIAYSIVRIDGRAAPGFEEVNPQRAELSRTGAGDQSVTAELGFVVPPTSAERVVIRFEAPDLIDPAARRARATLRLRDGGLLTRDVALPPAP